MKTKHIVTLATAAVIIIALLLVGAPLYRVWSQEQRGRAALAEASYNRQIIVQEAQARLEAAKLEAQSNRALIDSLGGDPDRLIAFRVIDQLGNANTIYIPTEAGIPILEAGRLRED